ncbi:hypothetical protein EUGRSUZ_E02440 [Eucalyptus grandis]|uniref:Uncharacterized protein n=2 Tax=Eucalyptus grandis TaxID=71139 RepID=A0ACC3KXC3_EUCGR|nr:hypothetical protein EUGRSUZ_E02440 [Eucalyptus grandis]
MSRRERGDHRVRDGKQGARVLLLSCQVQFELYPLYEEIRCQATAHSPTNKTSINSGTREKENSLEVQLLYLRLEIGVEFLEENYRGEKPVDPREFTLIRLDVICTATGNFSDECKLGEGRFGPVYKGTLGDGKEIAVKRLSRTSGQGLIKLKNEVILIARPQHRNLVRLVGFCLEEHENLLIYEYMPYKSLDVFLFGLSFSR